MLKEVSFIRIDGEYGGDQNFLPERQMIKGGCSAIVAAELGTCLANLDKKHKKLSPLTLYTSRESFNDYVISIYKYVWPKYRGLPSLDYFIECYDEYLDSVGHKVCYDRLDETASYKEAELFLKKHIDEGYPIAFLLLHHEHRLVYDITWHWFTLTGYEDTPHGLDVIFSTFGEKCRIPFKILWERGNPERETFDNESGGMLAIR